MGERAGIWVRVSSGGQDEASQLPDIERHCETNGYSIEKRYVLHDKSASKGEHEPALAQMLSDMAAGEISVLVCWQSSRLDRQGTKRGYAILAAVEMAGGRIEVTQEPEFGGDGFGDEIMTTVRMVTNRAESRTKSERVRIAFDAIDSNGAWRGKPPWGFVTVGDRRNKHLVPTAEAREYVPQVYARVIAGESLATIARWLESCGVAPVGIAKDRADGRGKSGQWWPRSVGQLIRNPAYMGRAVVNVTTQQTHDCEALVDAHTWAKAGRSLDARPKRGPVLRENRCVLSGAARCYKCGGPLYRIKCGNGNSAYYLRCAGTGAARQSCGAPMIRLDVAGPLADDVMSDLRNPVYEYREVPGNEAEIDAALAALDFQRRQVALRGLSWDEEDSERARIRAEYERVSQTPRVRSRRMPVDTGVSYGQRWAKLDTDGRAEWLRSGEFTVYLAKGDVTGATAVRDGVSLVLAWHDEEADAA